MFTEHYFAILVIGFVISMATCFYLLHKSEGNRSYKEIFLFPLAVFAVTTLVYTGIWTMMRFSAASDQEYWNGQVIAKDRIEKRCPSGWVSYEDNFCSEYRTRSVKTGEICSTDDKGRKTCTPTYSTEYKYHYATETRWYVSSNLKLQWEIVRVNRRGDLEPGRYAEVKIGDPVSHLNTYNNWIAGAAESLFHETITQEEEFMKVIPEYPLGIYDYYKADRVVFIDVPKKPEANAELSKVLGVLGPKYQMNSVIVFVNSEKYPVDFSYVVQKKWKGFKKNDVAIVIGVDSSYKLYWVNVFSWSKDNVFDINLRNNLLEFKDSIVTPTQVVQTLDKTAPLFIRRSFKEFEYLKDDIPPPISLLVLSALIMIISPLVFAFVLLRKDSSNEVPLYRARSFGRPSPPSPFIRKRS